ncbi:MAG: translation elongation factor Ts [Gemmataceae bacterium]
MSAISAAAVNELRKRTDRPLMECKKALTEANGDINQAVELLRSWDAKAGTKREANETAEGRVAIAVVGANAAIVELRCESAPTAKNEHFAKLADDIAKFIAENNPADVPALLAAKHGSGTIQDRINEAVGLIREKMVVHRFFRTTGGTYGQYVHHDGTVGALIHASGTPAAGADEVLRDACAHASAMNPTYVTTASIPTETVEKEKAFAMQQIKDDPKNASKPANIIEKIAEGKLKTWMAESVFTEQPMVNATKYPNTTIAAALAKVGLKVEKMVRYKVGAIGA